jgi:hypothetical protein
MPKEMPLMKLRVRFYRSMPTQVYSVTIFVSSALQPRRFC